MIKVIFLRIISVLRLAVDKRRLIYVIIKNQWEFNYQRSTYIHFQNNVEPYTIFILFCEGIYL